MQNEKTGTMEKYLWLDIMKFIMTIIVVVYHYNYFVKSLEVNVLFPGGYICVDMFFAISGFLLMKSLTNKKWGGLLQFTRHRVKTIGIQYYIALALAVVVYYLFRCPLLYKSYSIRDFLKELIVLAQEVLMVQEWGIYRGVAAFNGVAWYISAMLACAIVMFLIYKYIKRYISAYIFIFTATVTFLIIYIGNLHIHSFIYGHISISIVRGFAGMTIGAIAYSWREKISNCKFFMGLGYAALPMFLALCFVCRDNLLDFLVYPIGFFAVIALCHTKSSRWLEKKIEKWGIRKLSTVIYLNHTSVVYTLLYVYPDCPLTLYLICVIIVCVIQMSADKYISNLANKYYAQQSGVRRTKN